MPDTSKFDAEEKLYGMALPSPAGTSAFDYMEKLARTSGGDAFDYMAKLYGIKAVPAWVSSPANKSIALIGDSRANAGYSITTADRKAKTLSSIHWAALTLGQRFTRTFADYGTGGIATDAVVADFDAKLLADDSCYWRWISGGNDIVGNQTLSQIQAAYIQAAEIAYARQRILIVGEYPFSSAAMTTGQQDTQAALAAWLANVLPTLYPNVFDAGSWNATAATPGFVRTDPASGVSYDGKHLFSYGAWKAAKDGETALYRALFPDNTAVSTFPLVTGETVAYNAVSAPTGSLVSNWMLTGTNGSAPTGWTLTTLSGITAAWTYGTDATGFNEAILTLSGTPASSGFINLNQTIPSASILAGDVVRVGMRMALDAGSTGISAIASECRFTDGTPTTTIRVDMDSGGATLSGGNNLLNSASFDGPTAGPASQALLAGASYSSRSVRTPVIYFVSGVAVSAVIRLGRVTCRKV